MWDDNFPEHVINLQSETERARLAEFLRKQNLNLDNVEYTVAWLDREKIIATGSLDGNVLKCIAVDEEYKNRGMSAKIVTVLEREAFARGRPHLFIYTKPENKAIFSSLGFYSIAEVPDKIVLLENRPDGIRKYLQEITRDNQESIPGTKENAAYPAIVLKNDRLNHRLNQKSQREIVFFEGHKDDKPENKDKKKIAAIVMNCNPFTLGHQYLIEYAASRCQILHIFVLWEEKSSFPAEIRYRLVREGVRHLRNVVLHKGKDYLISAATFPSYFLKGFAEAAETQARLDLEIFTQYIAPALGIMMRFVGEEPYCQVTAAYNSVMREVLPDRGIDVQVVTRMLRNGQPVSASRVRELIRAGKLSATEELVPDTTYQFLTSPEAEGIIKRVQAGSNRH